MPFPTPETEAAVVPRGDAAPENEQELPPEPTSQADSTSVSSDFQIVIEPSRGWQLVNVRELWQYRELLGILAWRDIKVRYKQTILGAAWAILQPAMMMIVFTIFFGKLGKMENSTGGVPYPLFVFSGLLAWTFFSSAMTSSANSVVGSERLITKIYFPRLVIPYAAVLTAAIDFCLAFLLLLGLMLWHGQMPGLSILATPLIISVLAVAALGIGTGLSALNVSYRDFRHIIPLFTQLWLFATPAIYMDTSQAVEGWQKTLIVINPLNALIATFRGVVLSQPIPWNSLGLSVLVIVAMFIAGNLYFRKVEDGFADII